MKKLIIGLAAGVMALGASVVPASAGSGVVLNQGSVLGGYGPYDMPYSSNAGSIWKLIDGTNGTVEQLVLLAGLSNTLDQCGNNKDLYTVFLPTPAAIAAALTVLDVTVADLAEAPAAVKALLSDHIVDGAVDPYLMTATKAGIKKLVALSGYVINIRALYTTLYDGPAFWTDWYANGFQLQGATLTCNGWVYDMFGVFQAEDYAETFGTDNKPPTGSAVGELPDTL